MKRNKTAIILPIALMVVAFVFLLFRSNEPPLGAFWIEGVYEISENLLESGIILADIRLSDLVETNEIAGIFETQIIDFEVPQNHGYFKIVVYQSYPRPANMVWLAFSNEQDFELAQGLAQGNTHIFYTTEAWSAGRHSINIFSQRNENIDRSELTGHLHLQIIAAGDFETISCGLN
ncbi:MAG: hypothetical protein LBE35_00815 [Clostridiales bacterium]|jgi:hypothetical protein|nr:hypothetical protein [Clostridiales bacterium]